MNTIKKLIFVSFLLLAAACKKDVATLPVDGLNLKIIATYHSARLMWNEDIFRGNGFLYHVYIDDSLVLEKEAADALIIENLPENSSHTGRLTIIRLSDSLKGEKAFSFTTGINKAPGNFVVLPLKISSNTIEISWTKPIDPEAEAIAYEVLVNDSLVFTQSTDLKATVVGLLPQVQYRIKVMATDPGGRSNTQSYTFTTLKGTAEVLHQTLRVNGKLREYGLYKPSIQSSQKIPLLIYLHGAGGVIWPAITESYWGTIAEREKFMVVMPQALKGTTASGTYIQWNAHNLLMWSDVTYINNLIDSLNLKGNVDMERIYVSGMSNGGYMSFKLAMELQDRLAAVAPIAGLIDKTLFATYSLHKPVPLCYMHGTADDIVRIEGDSWSVGWNDILQFWLDNNQLTAAAVVTQLPDISVIDLSTVTKFEYKSYSGQEDIIFYQINNGGHSVPGIEPYANQDINAFEEIWQFLKRFRLNE